MQVAVVLYPGMTALDVIGPYEVLHAVPKLDVRFVAQEIGPVATDSGVLVLGATHTFDETKNPDILLIGGSLTATMRAAADDALLDWLRRAHDTSTWTTSVCSGSVILAAAGILDGVPATSHWAALGAIATLGAHSTSDQRVVTHGKIVTAAGVSAGIDMGLWLAGQVAGESTAKALQLAIEYDPQPPFDSGHLTKASPATKALATALMARNLRPSDMSLEAAALSRLAWRRALRRARRR